VRGTTQGSPWNDPFQQSFDGNAFGNVLLAEHEIKEQYHQLGAAGS
jgi:hypothetical protein